MATGDLPLMGASSYGSAAHSMNSFGNLQQQQLGQQVAPGVWQTQLDSPYAVAAAINQARITHRFLPTPDVSNSEEPTMASTRRLVQVFIADPNENVPLDQALLYKGEPKFTDATDQELFFEIDIVALLSDYNANRVLLVNKAVKDRTEYLEPVKIRELKMVVVTVAQF